jgi:hypothetical protein
MAVDIGRLYKREGFKGFRVQGFKVPGFRVQGSRVRRWTAALEAPSLQRPYL